MPSIETRHLAIDLPDEWSIFHEGRKLIAHGPSNTEIIATSVIKTSEATGVSPPTGRRDLAQLEMVQMMHRNGAQEGLVVNGDVTEEQLRNGLTVYTLSSISTDQEVHFDQFLLIHDEEILYLTFEGPASDGKQRRVVIAAIEETRLN